MDYQGFFGSRLRGKVLGWLFSHSDESFGVRQLAVILGVDPTNLSRELRKLEAQGIVSFVRLRNLKLCAADVHSPLFPELKGLVSKTMGPVGRLKAALGSVPLIRFAFIYGSLAAGREKSGSDIDLIIVGQVDLKALDSVLAKAEKDAGRTINYVLYRKSEFLAKRRLGDGFLSDVLRGKKIWLIGTDAELRETPGPGAHRGRRPRPGTSLGESWPGPTGPPDRRGQPPHR